MINSSPAPAAAPPPAIKVGCFMFCDHRCVMVFKPLKQGKTRCHLKIYETSKLFTLNLSQSIIIKAYQNNHQACKAA